ncbi:MAG: alpha/beta hydrolase [Solobacterium sp.]|nr:alpha/beta hydrolase [Solobacterium sp.]
MIRPWNAHSGSIALDSTRMEYVCFGTGKKNLIVIPGLSDGLATVGGMALALVPPYIEYLKDWTVYMFSRKNEMPEGYSIRDMAADQARVLEKLGVERTSVLGVSQGGMIAQYLAVDYPDLVEKLVIAVSAPYANDLIKQNIGKWMEDVRRNDHKALMIDTAEVSYTDAYLKKYRLVYPLLGWVGKPKNYSRFIRNAEAILSFDAREDLKNIRCPVYIIGGEQDRIVGVQASYELHDCLPGSTLFIHPDSGHGMNEEDKDFYHRIFRYLEEQQR